MAKDNKQDAYSYLLDLAAEQGYVTYDNIFDAAESWHLPLNDVDWLSNAISTIGILVYDDAPHISAYENDDDDYEDYAQSDYDELYEEVIENEPSLEPFINDIRHVRPAQYKEIPRLVEQAQDGNLHARNRLIEIHLRSALRIAYQRSLSFDESIIDCFGNACVGVVTAIDKYDPKRNGPLGSYVSMWVLQTMMREQPVKCCLYFPAHKREPFFYVYPSLKAYGCTDCDKILKCKKAREIVEGKIGLFQDEKDINDILIQSSTFMSLEDIAETGQDVDELFYEYDYYYNDYDSLAIANERKQIINKAISKLTERERYVIIRRFGFNNFKPMTLEEIAKELGVTRERIRQIEGKALRILNRSTDLRKLYDGTFEFRKYIPIKGSANNEINYIPKTAIAKAFPPNRFGLFLVYCYKRNVLYVEDLSKSLIDGFLSIVGDKESIKEEMAEKLAAFRLKYLIK